MPCPHNSKLFRSKDSCPRFLTKHNLSCYLIQITLWPNSIHQTHPCARKAKISAKTINSMTRSRTPLWLLLQNSINPSSPSIQVAILLLGSSQRLLPGPFAAPQHSRTIGCQGWWLQEIPEAIWENGFSDLRWMSMILIFQKGFMHVKAQAHARKEWVSCNMCLQRAGSWKDCTAARSFGRCAPKVHNICMHKIYNFSNWTQRKSRCQPSPTSFCPTNLQSQTNGYLLAAWVQLSISTLTW